ncbi:MAG: anti-sigma factor [Candidatus Tectimicrobiota bacterium]
MAMAFSCDHCEALLAGYLLRALEVEELRAVSAHLATCGPCQASLEVYQAVLDQLAQAVPPQEPPARIQQRLLTAALEAPEEPATLSDRRLQSKRRPSSWGWALTAANLLLCLGLAWLTWQARQEVIQTQRTLQELQQRLALQHQALTLIATPAGRTVTLRGEPASGQAHGVLWLQPEDVRALLVVQDMPPLQAHRAYQLWLVWGDRQRDNGGVFRVDEHGFGMLQITAPRPLASYRAIGITEEPAGGSPGPTSPRLIGASL